MITDVLANQALYRNLHPRFAVGLDYLLRFDPKTPDGRVDLDGDRVFALVQSYDTAPAKGKKFETHRQRIDIQYVAAGSELMYCAPIGAMKETEAYDPQRDAAFYADPAHATAIVCPPGSVTIFYPHDAHKGSCSLDTASFVKKVVIKVAV